MSNLLEVRGLTKHFTASTNWFGRPVSHVSAVDDVSFDLKPGETLSLVGKAAAANPPPAACCCA